MPVTSAGLVVIKYKSRSLMTDKDKELEEAEKEYQKGVQADKEKQLKEREGKGK